MRWPSPLIQGFFRKRYQRFFADIEADGKIFKAHVANTGSLKTALFPGAACWMTKSDDPSRKLPYSLQMVSDLQERKIGVNTSWPNKLVAELLQKENRQIWTEFATFQAEVRVSQDTRLDFLLSPRGALAKPRYLEVKNVTMLDSHEGRAVFPDAVTERGLKHIKTLVELTRQGYESELVFIVQREECHEFGLCWEIDPAYCEALIRANDQGVRITALAVEFSLAGLELKEKCLPLFLRRNEFKN